MDMQQPAVLGLPSIATSITGIDRIGNDCRVAEDISILRHGIRAGELFCLADGVSLFSGSRFVLGDISINQNAAIHIGARSIINVGGYISGEGGLEIGQEVLIGPHVRIFSAGHAIHGGEISIYRNPLTYASVSIDNGAWIGGGSTVLPGIRIGKGAVVGAGSVVTHDVPDFAIVAGNPARLLHYRAGHEPAESITKHGHDNWLRKLIRWRS